MKNKMTNFYRDMEVLTDNGFIKVSVLENNNETMFATLNEKTGSIRWIDYIPSIVCSTLDDDSFTSLKNQNIDTFIAMDIDILTMDLDGTMRNTVPLNINVSNNKYLVTAGITKTNNSIIKKPTIVKTYETTIFKLLPYLLKYSKELINGKYIELTIPNKSTYDMCIKILNEGNIKYVKCEDNKITFIKEHITKLELHLSNIGYDDILIYISQYVMRHFREEKFICTNSEFALNIIQSLLVISGNSTNVLDTKSICNFRYIITFTSLTISSIDYTDIDYKFYNKFIYTLKNPYGYFIVRDNNKVFVCR